MTEKQLQQAVVECARLLGWRVYHTYDSRRSDPGWPDLFMVHPMNGMVPYAIELKTDTGKVSNAQHEWLELLDTAGGCMAVVWRPKDWHSGLIEQKLRLNANAFPVSRQAPYDFGGVGAAR